jgi:integrase
VLYRRAIDRDEFGYNPAERIDLPAADSRAPEYIPSAAEAEALIAALPLGDRALWATAFYAGLRRGELQALRVCDVNLAASTIKVAGGWDQYEGAQDPKTFGSRRTVPLLAILRDYLDAHLLRMGPTGEALVFGRSASQAFAPTTIDKRAKRCWKAANEAAEGRELLHPVTMHDARHTFASLLIDSGANAKAVQEAMGHKRIATTYDIYGHLLDGSRDELRQRMDAYLADATGTVIEADDERASEHEEAGR